MMSLVDEALDEPSGKDKRLWKRPEDRLAEYAALNPDTFRSFNEQMFRDTCKELGMFYFTVSRNPTEAGVEIRSLDSSEILQAICFIWNFLDEWSAQKGTVLQASDFADLSLSDTQADALIDLISTVNSVVAPVWSDLDDDLEYDDDSL